MGIDAKMSVSGAAEFKRNMNEAASSVKNLDAQLKLNEKQFKLSGDAEKYMQEKSKLLQQQMKEQNRVIQEGQRALKTMKEQGIDEASRAFQDMERRVYDAQAELINMQMTLQEVEQGFTSASGGAGKLTDNLNNISKNVSLDSITNGLKSVSSLLENAAKTALGLGETIFNSIMDKAKWADDSATMAMMYGIDLETFLQMQKLVDNGMDTSVDAILSAQSKLKKNVGTGSDGFMATLKELNLLHDTAGKFVDGKWTQVDVVTQDSVDLFWEAGKAIMALTDEYEQEEKAQQLFGRGWKELVPLFTQFSSRGEYEKALESTSTLTEEEVSQLAELNNKMMELQGTFDTVVGKIEATMAPALSAAAESLTGLLESVLDYLERPEGQQALKDMETAVSGLFEDLGKIDPEEVVEGFKGVFDSIVGGLQWLVNNKDDVGHALEHIVGLWAAVKITGGAADILHLITGIQGLTGAGATAAGEAGTTFGASWGAAFGAAVLKAAPWLAFFYTLLNPELTPSGDDSVTKDDFKEALIASHEEAKFGESGGSKDTWVDNWIPGVVADSEGFWSDERAIDALADYIADEKKTDEDRLRLAKKLQSLGHELTAEDDAIVDTIRDVETKMGIIRDTSNDNWVKPADREDVGTGAMLKDVGELLANVYTFNMYDKAKQTIADISESVQQGGGAGSVLGNIGEFLANFYTLGGYGFIKDRFFTDEDADAKVKVAPELTDDAQQVLQEQTDHAIHLEVVADIVPNYSGLMGGSGGSSAQMGLSMVDPSGSGLLRYFGFGHFANGLWSVPWDGYPAILHKGERVVPAREVGSSRNFSSNLYVENMNMNSGMDADGLAARIAAANRRTMAGFG